MATPQVPDQNEIARAAFQAVSIAADAVVQREPGVLPDRDVWFGSARSPDEMKAWMLENGVNPTDEAIKLETRYRERERESIDSAMAKWSSDIGLPMQDVMALAQKYSVGLENGTIDPKTGKPYPAEPPVARQPEVESGGAPKSDQPAPEATKPAAAVEHDAGDLALIAMAQSAVRRAPGVVGDSRFWADADESAIKTWLSESGQDVTGDAVNREFNNRVIERRAVIGVLRKFAAEHEINEAEAWDLAKAGINTMGPEQAAKRMQSVKATLDAIGLGARPVETPDAAPQTSPEAKAPPMAATVHKQQESERALDSDELAKAEAAYQRTMAARSRKIADDVLRASGLASVASVAARPGESLAGGNGAAMRNVQKYADQARMAVQESVVREAQDAAAVPPLAGVWHAAVNQAARQEAAEAAAPQGGDPRVARPAQPEGQAPRAAADFRMTMDAFAPANYGHSWLNAMQATTQGAASQAAAQQAIRARAPMRERAAEFNRDAGSSPSLRERLVQKTRAIGHAVSTTLFAASMKTQEFLGSPRARQMRNAALVMSVGVMAATGLAHSMPWVAEHLHGMAQSMPGVADTHGYAMAHNAHGLAMVDQSHLAVPGGVGHGGSDINLGQTTLAGGTDQHFETLGRAIATHDAGGVHANTVLQHSNSELTRYADAGLPDHAANGLLHDFAKQNGIGGYDFAAHPVMTTPNPSLAALQPGQYAMPAGLSDYNVTFGAAPHQDMAHLVQSQPEFASGHSVVAGHVSPSGAHHHHHHMAPSANLPKGPEDGKFSTDDLNNMSLADAKSGQTMTAMAEAGPQHVEFAASHSAVAAHHVTGHSGHVAHLSEMTQAQKDTAVMEADVTGTAPVDRVHETQLASLSTGGHHLAPSHHDAAFAASHTPATSQPADEHYLTTAPGDGTPASSAAPASTGADAGCGTHDGAWERVKNFFGVTSEPAAAPAPDVPAPAARTNAPKFTC